MCSWNACSGASSGIQDDHSRPSQDLDSQANKIGAPISIYIANYTSDAIYFECRVIFDLIELLSDKYFAIDTGIRDGC